MNNYQGNNNRPRPNKNQNTDLVNERIHFKEVLLIGPEGEAFGVVPMKVAQQKSIEAGMDLLCVSPNAKPPVCRIIDYGKYKFEKDKKAKEAKKNQKKTVVKEVRFTATTDTHDLETKAKATMRFLAEGNKVKASVFIKGRMRSRMDIVQETLNKFLAMVADCSVHEKEPEMMGRDYYVVLSPKKK
ncbi:MAG: translation initiation factor IF-3 [Bacilli bacterium]|nr:translation initiation factor IF-3 [Bacilli bacterium]